MSDSCRSTNSVSSKNLIMLSIKEALAAMDLKAKQYDSSKTSVFERQI